MFPILIGKILANSNTQLRDNKNPLINSQIGNKIIRKKWVFIVHIIAKSRLRNFWESNSACLEAIEPLTEWYRHFEKATYQTPQEIKQNFGNASILKGGRVVFNIGGNKYRLIVAFDYERQAGFIKFIGTHADYDKVTAEEVE